MLKNNNMRKFTLKFTLLGLSLTTLLFNGCIENDIPYPVIKANITSFEVQGQNEATIDEVKREVTVTLPEAADIQNLKILKFAITEDAKCTPAPTEFINLATPQQYTLSIYQDYVWTIKATQNIERILRVENQTGQTSIDPVNLMAVAYVASSQDITNVKILEMKLGATGSVTTPDPLSVVDFSEPRQFAVVNHGRTETWTVAILQTESVVETLPTKELWAKSALLYGSFKTGTTDVHGFEYKKSSASTWTKIADADIITNGSEMSAWINALDPNTNYVYRAFIGEIYGDERSFTTPSAPLIPNMTMDGWNLNGKNWCPWAIEESPYWATGNSGVTLFKDSNTVPTDDAVSGKAAKLTTISVPLVELAAGNLFTGDFKTDLGNPLNSTLFGRPFTGRPRKFAFMAKYSPKIIDVAKNKPEAKGQMDRASGWIKLEDWGGETAKRPANAKEIAYSVIYITEETPTYTRFEIPVNYSSDATPTHITVTFSSSYLGDFYTGGVGSVLYVDNIELLY